MARDQTKLVRERLQKARAKAPNPMTQAVLAVTIGRDPMFISRLERGLTSPRLSDLIAISVALGVRYEWLTTGEGKMCDGAETGDAA